MAITFTKADLVLRFPEFGEASPAQVAAMLDMARDYVDEEALSSKAKTGLMLYTAHLLTLATRGGSKGSLTASKVGDLSESFSQAGPGNGMASTTYGEQYQKLISGLLAGGVFVQASFTPQD